MAARLALDRLLRPRSVAIVGANDRLPQSNNAHGFMAGADVEIFLVNPTRESLYGRRCHPDLKSIGRPVDAVLGLVNAERTVALVDEALAAGAGGLIAHAGGFGETGVAGATLERQLVERACAGGLPVIGPNCSGYVDFNRRIKMSGAPPLPASPGGVALVTQSGSLLVSVATAGHDRRIGFGHVISTGNEAVVDLTDCIDFLVDDPATRAICLVVEAIRRPQAFFAAAHRAAEANKPIVALKLGRSERARRIASSHTGAIAGDAWVTEMAFRQHGIGIARDIAELVDRVALFDQLPPARWSPVRGIAVATPSGGGAGLLCDVFADFDLPLPSLDSVDAPMRVLMPTSGENNPLDLTGFLVTKPAAACEIVKLYAGAREADTVVLGWFVDDGVMTIGKPFLDTLPAVAAGTDKTFVYGSFDDGQMGSWARTLPEHGIAVTRGILSMARALDGMRNFVRYRERWLASEATPSSAPLLPRPAASHVVASEIGAMVRFATAMALVAQAGIEVAPCQLVKPRAALGDLAATVRQAFSGPYVAKLADVPHRTDIGAVRLGLPAEGLAAAVTELRALAERLGLPGDVAIQPQLKIDGEAFLGIQAQGSLDSTVLFGVGGTQVEVLKAVGGLVLPFNRAQVHDMFQLLAPARVFEGARGAPPWDREQLADAVLAAQALAQGSAGWLGTLDINPLVFSGGRFVAVDALCTLAAGR